MAGSMHSHKSLLMNKFEPIISIIKLTVTHTSYNLFDIFLTLVSKMLFI